MNPDSQRILRVERGASLVELLVAAVVGIIILGVVVSMYFANRNVYRFQEAYSRIQESGRYAMEVLGQDFRGAAYVDCGKTPYFSNIITNSTAVWWLNTNRMIWGYDQGAALPVELNRSVADSDVLVVMTRSSQNEATISGHNTTTKQIQTAVNHSFSQGMVLYASGCATSGVFRMSNAVAAASNMIEYTSGVLGGGYDNSSAPGPSLSSIPFPPGGIVAPFITNAYFVMAANDPAFASNPCPSDDNDWVRRVLVVRTLSGATDAQLLAAQPVACDVQNFQVRYGIDNDDDLSADEFRSATDLGINESLWSRVVSVRVDMLVVNPKARTQESDQRFCLDYIGGVAPTACPAAPDASYTQVWKSDATTGRRAAKVFTTTFGFRNRTT